MIGQGRRRASLTASTSNSAGVRPLPTRSGFTAARAAASFGSDLGIDGTKAMKLQPPRAFTTPADLDAMVGKAREASEFLKALAQESRLLILCALAGGEKSVGALEAFLSQRQSTVSQQLARLRLENLVAARREGATIYYRLADEKVRTVLAAVHETFCAPKGGVGA